MKTKVKFVLSTLVAAAAMNSTALADGKIYVSSDYNSSTEGWDKTHFSSYADAYAYASVNNKEATIIVKNTNTISGNTFDNNHKNYSKLAVEVEGGAVVGNAASKWDMTYAVTVEAGGVLQTARGNSSGYGNSHIKNTLTIGEAGVGKETAYVKFQNADTGYKTASIAVLYNGKLVANNADIKVGDLGFTGSATINDSVVDVEGVVAFGKNIFYSQSMTNTTMTVKGHNLMNENTYYSTVGTILNKLTMTNSSITVDDGAEGTVAEAVTIKNLTMSESALTVEAGTAVKVTGNFKLNDSSLSVGMLTNNGTITVSGESYLDADGITGNKIVVSEGATLTLSSSSLLAMVDNTANKGAGNIVFNKVDSQVKDVNEITLKNADGKAVELSSGTGTITVNVASEITDASEISVIEAVSGGVVLAAWSFDIDNGEGENKTGVTVTMDVGEGQVLESLRILHEENGEWTDVTSVVTDKKLENGKLSFTAKDFSGYAVATPEPSMFGLMAGLGALVLVGTRRRRK